jgi:hypothetical protein
MNLEGGLAMGAQISSHFSSAVGRLAGFIPNLLSAIVILAVGILLSRLVGALARKLLARVGFDGFADRHLRLRAAAPRRSASALVGSAVFWLGTLLTVSMAANSLNLRTLSAGINGILAFIPRVVVACVIVGVAIAAARVLARFIGDVAGGTLAKGAQGAVIVLAVFMALDELGVSKTIVTTTFTAILGAAAVAAAIAFGVGNIGLARDYTHRLTSRRLERPPAPRREEIPASAVEPLEPTKH